MRSVIPIALILVVAACTETGSFMGPASRESCSLPGMQHSGAESTRTWRRADSPHVLLDSVYVKGRLTIEPSTLICGAPGSSLSSDDLQAIGAPDLSIVFTSTTTEGWNGLRGAGTLRQALIENTELAISGNPFILEDVHIVRSQRSGVSGSADLMNVVIDSACSARMAYCGAVESNGYSSVRLKDVSIRWSGGYGISTGWRLCGVVLDGGLIEGSAKSGLDMMTYYSFSCELSVIKPMRITGGGEYPATIHAQAAVELLSHPDALAAMTGNARDTLKITGEHGFRHGSSITIGAALPVTYAIQCPQSGPAFPIGAGSIVLEPGASLTLSNCAYVAQVAAVGTVDDPITISGSNGGILRLVSSGATPYEFRHVRLKNSLRVIAESPTIFSDIRMETSSLTLNAGSEAHGLWASGSAGARPWVSQTDTVPTVTLVNGSKLRRAHIENATYDGVQVADGSSVVLEECTITGSARYGVNVLSGAPTIRLCNVMGNAMAGLRNAGADIVDARNNWWGDPNGPGAPTADRVLGDALTEPARTSVFQFSCGLSCMSPTDR